MSTETPTLAAVEEPEAEAPPRRRTRRSASTSAPSDAERADRVQKHRQQQASVSTILDVTFGKLGDSDPSLWERRAYLMLVGMVYERLAIHEDKLPADELVALAKVLAENRRGESRPKEASRPEDSNETVASSTGPLPNRFADMVRELYGVETGPQTSP